MTISPNDVTAQIADVRRLSPEERYRRDSRFHQLVDVLEHLIGAAELTGTEVREAAMLACIHHEAKNVRPILLKREHYEQLVNGLQRRYGRGAVDLWEQRLNQNCRDE